LTEFAVNYTSFKIIRPVISGESPPMRSVAEQIKLNLQPLVGLKLSRMALAAGMRTIQFGNTERRASGGVVGEYTLHIQCPWRLETDKGLVTGSDDLNVPYELGDRPEGSFDLHTGRAFRKGSCGTF
jgi:hypothetical protein